MDEKEIEKIVETIRDHELIFSASKSSGPGGQHVNKVNTKAEIRFDIRASAILSDEQKDILHQKLASKINKEGILIVTSQSSRSQIENKIKATEKCLALIRKALTPGKKRKPTKPSKAAIARRLEEKKKVAEKKEQRKPPEI